MPYMIAVSLEMSDEPNLIKEQIPSPIMLFYIL